MQWNCAVISKTSWITALDAPLNKLLGEYAVKVMFQSNFMHVLLSYFSHSNPVPDEKELISTSELEISFNKMLNAYKEREEVKIPIFVFQSV